nr:hypothetical protein KitaXyl93_05740 [Kitasatospora sp. Xyl93]
MTAFPPPAGGWAPVVPVSGAQAGPPRTEARGRTAAHPACGPFADCPVGPPAHGGARGSVASTGGSIRDVQICAVSKIR